MYINYISLYCPEIGAEYRRISFRSRSRTDIHISKPTRAIVVTSPTNSIESAQESVLYFFSLLSLFHALSNARTRNDDDDDRTRRDARRRRTAGTASLRHINRYENDASLASRLPAVRRDEGILRVAKERRWWWRKRVRRRVQAPSF